MGIYSWYEWSGNTNPVVVDGQTFNPNSDQIDFGPGSFASSGGFLWYDPLDPAGQGYLNVTAGGQTITLQLSGTSVDLNNPMLSLKRTSFKFADGSVVQIGDGLVSSAGDNNSLTVNGTAGGDVLVVFGGNDTVNGGAGNDLVILDLGTGTGLPSADVVDGGAGNDHLVFTSNNGSVNVDMIAGTAIWTNNSNNSTVSLKNFETVSGTPGSDLMRGGVANFTWIDYDWTAPGVGYVDVQTFRASSGYDRLAGSGLADGLRQSADYSRWGTGINMQSFGGGDHNPWRQVFKGAFGASEQDQLYDVTRVIGSNFDDVLLGGSSVRNQFGDRQEEFIGGGGNDMINGFDGYDQVFYNSAAQGITVDLAAGTATDGLTGNDTLMNIEGVIGSSFGDILYGSDANNFFQMRSGNDVVDGRGGFDKVSYQGSTTGVNVSLAMAGAQLTGKDYITGSGAHAQGTDTLTDIEALRGTDFNDTLTGGSLTTTNRGLTGNRREEFEGRAGNDIIDGGNDHAANFDLYGDLSLGYDYASYARAPEAVAINLGLKELDGSVLAADGYGTTDKLVNINGLIGTRFDDVLIGDTENNVFMGNAGSDIIDGGGGFDLVRFDSALEDVYVDLDAGFADDGMWYWTEGPLDQFGYSGMNGQEFGSEMPDMLVNVEGATGSAHDDHFIGDANANAFYGGGGWDSFDSRDAGIDTLVGGDGGDMYWVKLGDVVIEVFNPDDVNDAGDDVVISFGNFTIAVGNAIEMLLLRGGNPATGVGRSGIGNEIGNTIFGTQYNDTLSGGAGNDTLRGGGGNDLINGGAGNDTLVFAAATSAVTVTLNSTLAQNTGEGTDTISNFENLVGSSFADMLTGRDISTTAVTANNKISGGGGTDYIYGLGGNDTLDGGNGADMIVGGTGNDVLLGGSGGDMLAGGAGRDTLTGGAGNDSFMFDVAPSGAAGDAITDFVVGQDKISLDQAIFTALPEGAVQSANFKVIGGSAGGATTTTQFLLYFADTATQTGYLYYDADGVGTGVAKVEIARLAAVNGVVPSLTASNVASNIVVAGGIP